MHESGSRVGFGTGLLRDTICRLLFVIPLVGTDRSLMPLGREHQSLRDKMMSTRVRAGAGLPLATLAADDRGGPGHRPPGWALSVVGETWDETGASAELGNGYQAIDRDAFISGCRDEGGGETTCACAFDYIKARLSYDEYAEADRTANTSEVGAAHAPRDRRRVHEVRGAGGEDPAIGA